MLLPGRIYIVRGSWRFEDFPNLFLPNTVQVKTKKKGLTIILNTGPLALHHLVNQPYSLHYVRKKAYGSNF